MAQGQEAAHQAGLLAIVCVGETQSQHEAGQTHAVVEAQLRACLPESGEFLLAYEPVWAIGSGLVPTTHDIAAMHAHIALIVGRDVPVLYGGSVKAANASEIFAIAGVSGVLVGGASLVVDEFCGIIAAAEG